MYNPIYVMIIYMGGIGMSWETTVDKVEKCECGKGKIRQILRSDDWNNYESIEYISCKECYEAALKSQANSYKNPNPVKHDDTRYIYCENI